MNKRSQEIRLDNLLMERGYFSSRSRAEAHIRDHGVEVNGQMISKPGKKLDPNSKVRLTREPMPWVSRGALKLLKALDHYEIDVNNRTCLDIGSSTGGFTEVLLERGASLVYSIDTGCDQLHKSLVSNPNVLSLENTDIRDWSLSDEQDRPSFCCTDVSFISLGHIFPEMKRLCEDGALIIALYKPQFEVGKKYLTKKGVVKDAKRAMMVMDQIIQKAELSGLKLNGKTESPIKGGDGNTEWLLYFHLEKD